MGPFFSFKIWNQAKSWNSYWKRQSKPFMDAAGLLQDSTVYFGSTAYEITGSELAIILGRFLSGLANDGLIPKLIALYPFIGVNYNSAKLNIINPLDTDAAHRIEAGGTPVYSGIGVTVNGTDNYLRTNVIPSAQGAYNNFSIGSYILSEGTQNRALYGVVEGDDKRLLLYPNYDASISMIDIPGYSNRITVAKPNSGVGLWQFWTRNDGLYWSVDDIDQVGIASLATVTMPDLEIYLGANNNGGTPAYFMAVDLCAWYYGIDMTEEDTSNIAIRLNRLMIDLKRIAV
jgi:hypothetical protein